ncbi:uncharacterized protein LOC111914038 [Lactuca sativa]|uniref:uncharacterized protein LOC111914038 n=1 Tax=Lactuca sativa TaxID=4236 RepID=UPI000CD7ECD7|nr:uncharacterized protein LOC111914038 [Lactuca sativa]
MSPRRNPRRGEAAVTAPPPPPPPLFDPAMFQAAIAAAVAVVIAQINPINSGGASSGASNSNNGDGQGCSRECTYKDFTNAKPKTFNGSGGVIALLQWFEKTETIFEICTCPEASKVKFTSCTFSERALTWWKGHVKALRLPVANAITWEDLKTMLMKEYCPRGEIQKLEEEFWGLKMKGSDILSYTSRFSDLAMLCPGMVPTESKKVERYVWGLSQQLQGHVQPTQDPAKKQQVVAVHTITTTANPTPIRQYAGNLPKCNKCSYHHNGACHEMHCTNCNKKGHTARFYRTPAQPNAQVANAEASRTCYGCGEAGHLKRNCPKARNPNPSKVGRVLLIGHKEAVADPTMVTDTFPLNNTYACILFDSGVEKSFVNHQFKCLLNQTPQTLKETFTVEMANGKTENTNDIYTGCTLNLNNHSFLIDLMTVTIKSFDVIIGMDWLCPHHAEILCEEKVVRLNLPSGEALVVYGDKPSSNFQIISCIKAQKYLRKEYHAFVSHVVDKGQGMKDINDIPEVCKFPDVFPEDLPGVPPPRQVEFQIDLIRGATPVAKLPYCLALAEMQEMSSQLNELLSKGFIRPRFSPWGAPVLFVK